jgi:hypothetical protein
LAHAASAIRAVAVHKVRFIQTPLGYAALKSSMAAINRVGAKETRTLIKFGAA